MEEKKAKDPEILSEKDANKVSGGVKRTAVKRMWASSINERDSDNYRICANPECGEEFEISGPFDTNDLCPFCRLKGTIIFEPFKTKKSKT